MPVSTVPVAPTNLTATPGDLRIVLNWSASASATGYSIRRATGSGGPYTTLGTVSGTTYTDAGLSNGTTYCYVVTATNAGGPSANSSEASASPLPAPPATPANLVAAAGNAQVVLSWTASSGATSYTLTRGLASGQETITVSNAITGTSFTDTNLVNGSTYYYLLTASNLGGLSGHSNEASAKPVQTFSQWIAAAFPGQSDPAVIGSAANPDGDAYSNLIEYFLGTNPAAPDGANAITGATDGKGNMLFDFRMAKNLTGVTYTIQQSPDLVNWSETGVAGSVISDQGSYSLTLSGVDTYAGSTTVSNGTLSTTVANATPGGAGGTLASTSGIVVNGSGTLLLSASNSVNAAAPVSLGSTSGTTGLSVASGVLQGQGATLSSGVVSGNSVKGFGALTLTSNATLTFAGASGTIVFSSFSPGTFTLNVTGTTFSNGSSSADGSNDRLIFNTNESANLADFTFNGVAGAQEIALDTGFYEIVPVPEPATWLGGALLAFALGCEVRRRFAGISYQR